MFDYLKEYEKWCNLPFLEKDLRLELEKIKNDDTAKKNQFSCFVEFGTAGMRGTMGVGPNRLNLYTIRKATIGVAKYVIKKHKEKKGVLIIYDTRNNSKLFANYIAKILSEFGILVYISKDIRPTPFLSFAVLEMKAFLGINITASHNKKEDNGYKIYLSNGAQMSFPDDKEIIDLVSNVKDKEIFVNNAKLEFNSKLINFIPKSIEDKFLKKAESHIINKEYCKKHGKELKIVYTPLHGTGNVFLSRAFKEIGFSNVYVVKEQDDRCGEFKTLAYPNPESADAYKLALKLAKEKDADIIVATDPDADRLGVYVRESKGVYMPLTGNELASVIYESKIRLLFKTININNAMAAKSFVTTRLIDAISKNYGIELKSTPTGFKWIGRVMDNTKKDFIFGAEESYGFVLSDYVRDKDSISATLFVLELSLLFKKINLNLYKILQLIYNKYGVYRNYAISIVYEGVAGKEKINNIMKALRKKPFKKLTDILVNEIIDYKFNTKYDIINGKKSSFEFETNDSIKFVLSDNSTIMIRPSGTEPKVKIYFDIVDKTIELADNKFDILSSALKKILV